MAIDWAATGSLIGTIFGAAGLGISIYNWVVALPKYKVDIAADTPDVGSGKMGGHIRVLNTGNKGMAIRTIKIAYRSDDRLRRYADAGVPENEEVLGITVYDVMKDDSGKTVLQPGELKVSLYAVTANHPLPNTVIVELVNGKRYAKEILLSQRDRVKALTFAWMREIYGDNVSWNRDDNIVRTFPEKGWHVIIRCQWYHQGRQPATEPVADDDWMREQLTTIARDLPQLFKFAEGSERKVIYLEWQDKLFPHPYCLDVDKLQDELSEHKTRALNSP